jgi:hypothetical protein
MFSDLPGLRAELKSRLEPALPGWRIVDTLADVVDTVVPVLYFEYTEIASSVNGQPMNRYTVAPKIDLVLASAGPGDEDSVDALILPLVHVLQRFEDIFWDTATKQRLSNGAFAWRISLTLLSHIPPSEE